MTAEHDDGAAAGEQDRDPAAHHSVVIVDNHMTSEHEEAAVAVALEAVDRHHHLKDIAFHVKTAYDRRYPGSGKATEGVYHCVVGSNFASAVSHEKRQYIRLVVDTLHIVLWKSKDSPFHFHEA
eukprot:evm.model.scf_394.3 EVM.evm.TU.scf_394.3   scf_394:36694-39325(+)